MPPRQAKRSMIAGTESLRGTTARQPSARGARKGKPEAPVPLIGEIRLEAGPAFSSATRLRVRGLNFLMQPWTAQEKEKVSITLDKTLVDEIRAQFGDRALSASINDLLYSAMAQERLAELVDEMEEEAGLPSPQAFERVLAEWFAES